MHTEPQTHTNAVDVAFVDTSAADVLSALGKGLVTTLEVERGTSEKASVIATRDQNGQVKLVSTKPFVDELLTRPERVVEGRVVHDIDSFVSIANRFKRTGESVVFADIARGALTAVFDYHRPAHECEPSEQGGWAKHRAGVQLEKTEAFEAWSKPSTFTMTEFAEWLENHLEDVLETSALSEESPTRATCRELALRPATRAELLNLARGIEVRADRKFVERRNTDTGATALVFEEDVRGAGGAPLNVPNALLVCVRPYKASQDAYVFPVRLRFRATPQGIVWGIAPHRAEKALEDAFEGIVTQVATQTELPVFRGVA